MYLMYSILIKEWGGTYCRSLLETLANNIVSLSMQKFSSNVVEKSFDLSDEVLYSNIAN